MNVAIPQVTKKIQSVRARYQFPIVLILCALVLLQGVRLVGIVTRLRRDMQSVQASTQYDMMNLLTNDLTEIESLLDRTASDLRDLRSTVGPFIYLGPLFRWVPYYGGDLAAAPALVDLAEEGVGAGQDALDLAHAINDSLKVGKTLKMPIGALTIEIVQTQAPLIQRIRQGLADMTRIRRQIDTESLDPSLRAMMYRVDKPLLLGSSVLDTFAMAPSILGADRPRTYLLLAQNSDEIRATGGFISSIALVKMNRGEITVTDFADSYAVDDRSKLHPTPPTPLLRYMDASTWVLRDSNWSPDFPTSARIAENIYRIDQGITVDGVIAVNSGLLPRLLYAVGPVTVNSGKETVDSGNVMQKVESYWAAPSSDPTLDWWEHRKDFEGSLLKGIMQRLQGADFDRSMMMRALYESMLAKDVSIYLNDMNAEEQTNSAWSGALYRGSDDALMVVDSNVGFNKVAKNIERYAEYTVSLGNTDTRLSTLTITYINHSPASGGECVHAPVYLPTYAELRNGCYWNYLRVVAPVDSELVQAEGILDVTTEAFEGMRTIFGGYFLLPRGGTQTVSLVYKSPATPGNLYALRWEKQPGSTPMPVQVRVEVPGGQIKSANPVPLTSGAALEFQMNLDRDRDVQVNFERGIFSGVIGTLFGLSILAALGALVYGFIQRRKPRVKTQLVARD